MAVAERRLNDHDEELDRTRDRLHLIEGDRSAIVHLSRAIEAMPAQLRDLAEASAEKAVRAALRERGELAQRGLGLFWQSVMAAAAVAGAATSIVLATHG